MMEDYQVHMIETQSQLQDEVNELTKFINSDSAFSKLPKEERDDMRRQLKGMRIYLDSLTSRINRFKK